MSPTGKCTDDGRGLVKTLSERLARKLQRSASLVNAGLSKNIQTVLDAATVDRCDSVEICCSDAPCLTEAMQRRGLSSFSLLRSDGHGHHDAKTRLLWGWPFLLGDWPFLGGWPFILGFVFFFFRIFGPSLSGFGPSLSFVSLWRRSIVELHVNHPLRQSF